MIDVKCKRVRWVNGWRDSNQLNKKTVIIINSLLNRTKYGPNVEYSFAAHAYAASPGSPRVENVTATRINNEMQIAWKNVVVVIVVVERKAKIEFHLRRCEGAQERETVRGMVGASECDSCTDNDPSSRHYSIAHFDFRQSVYRVGRGAEEWYYFV